MARQLQMIWSRASSQSTNRPQREQRSTTGFAPNPSLDINEESTTGRVPQITPTGREPQIAQTNADR
jgi:hypothetical protein